MVDYCSPGSQDRRKTFWTNQKCGGTVDPCGNLCSTVGMQPKTGMPSGYASFDTSNWVQSLALNILLTEGAVQDSRCGYRPGNRGGHWSDSYREQAGSSGSHLRSLGVHGTVRDAIRELIAYAQMDLEKLVTYGVASSVTVTAKYLGNNQAELTAEIIGQDGDIHKIGITGTRLKNSWAWNQ
jgi:phage gp46-like protein